MSSDKDRVPRRVQDLPERYQELIRHALLRAEGGPDLPPELWERALLWELGEPVHVTFIDERWPRFGRPSHCVNAG
jgi:hypothetical protein